MDSNNLQQDWDKWLATDDEYFFADVIYPKMWNVVASVVNKQPALLKYYEDCELINHLIALYVTEDKDKGPTYIICNSHNRCLKIIRNLPRIKRDYRKNVSLESLTINNGDEEEIEFDLEDERQFLYQLEFEDNYNRLKEFWNNAKVDDNRYKEIISDTFAVIDEHKLGGKKEVKYEVIRRSKFPRSFCVKSFDKWVETSKLLFL